MCPAMYLKTTVRRVLMSSFHRLEHLAAEWSQYGCLRKAPVVGKFSYGNQ